MTARRKQAEARGRWAEFLALQALRLKGYRLLARRFQSKRGEVDLIMRRGDVTCFIEVKARPTFDAGMEAVSVTQIRRIQQAALSWQAKDPRAATGICRFDIVVVCPYQWPQHIENAFYGES